MILTRNTVNQKTTFTDIRIYPTLNVEDIIKLRRKALTELLKELMMLPNTEVREKANGSCGLVRISRKCD